jgi:DNA repair exonuclease SbcCD ATPase subunit
VSAQLESKTGELEALSVEKERELQQEDRDHVARARQMEEENAELNSKLVDLESLRAKIAELEESSVAKVTALNEANVTSTRLKEENARLRADLQKSDEVSPGQYEFYFVMDVTLS